MPKPSSFSLFDSQSFMETVSSLPGIYDMRNKQGETLYIGKAKNLKKRLASYFRKKGLGTKTIALVEKIADIQVIVTNTETEALLLEQNLIKTRKPPYNILLRDDKSYPYILLSSDVTWPALSLYRGKKKKHQHFFGPYPSVQATRETLAVLQKVFKVRQCKDSFFKNRSRPCLQHQINRCKAPCVNLVSHQEYQQDIRDTEQFLNGKSNQLIAQLVKRMDNASVRLAFEEAAELRDQIQHLQQIQQQQSIEGKRVDIDVIGVSRLLDTLCYSVLFIRSGSVAGSKQFFIKDKLSRDKSELLSDFLSQFYVYLSDSRQFPDEIITPWAMTNTDALKGAINQQSGKTIDIKHIVRTERAGWQSLANKNALQGLHHHISNRKQVHERYQSLSELLNLPVIQRMECFDISHTMGEATVASCVVFDGSGPVKSEYRCFNIDGINPGDDYAAMKAVLYRRYRYLYKNLDKRPSVIIIDGGKGQLSMAHQVMALLNLEDIPLLGVAKGISRKPGLETLIYNDQELPSCGKESALFLIQQIRDESHRFAIQGHRARRTKQRRQSTLEDISGVGQKRRTALLKYFGGLQGVLSAPVKELQKVPGISHTIASQIYDYLHD